MEAMIAVFIFIGLLEWRNFMSQKRERAEHLKLQALKRLVDRLAQQNQMIIELMNQAMKDISTVNQKTSEAQEFIASADVNLKTIVNEYKLNGTPLGYIRKPQQEADFYEAL